jgi:hypothetical protein
MDLKEMNAQLGKVELHLRRLKDEIVEAAEDAEGCDEGCDGEDGEDEGDDEEETDDEGEGDGEDEED